MPPHPDRLALLDDPPCPRRRGQVQRSAAPPVSCRSIACCAREGRNSTEKPGRRTGRRGRKNPKADQPQAIAELVEGTRRNDRIQVLLGVTGSGKTFTMAKVIEQTQRPALI